MTDAGLLPPPLKKRRRRPAFACVQCRSRKVRCDQASPCSNCVKFKRTECVYASDAQTSSAGSAPASASISEPPPPPPPLFAEAYQRAAPLSDQSGLPRLLPQERSIAPAVTELSPSVGGSVGAGSSVGSALGSSSSVRSLVDRVDRLESRFQGDAHIRNVSGTPGSGSGSGSGSRSVIPSTSSLNRNQAGRYERPLPVKDIQHKSYRFGPSHWSGGATLLPIVMVIFRRAMKNPDCEFSRIDKRCKALARFIKSQRIPSLVFPLQQFGQHLPQRQVADALVECYLRTFESIFRIVHIPDFREEYEQYWESPATAKPAFINLLQICMAVGTCFHDETWSLRDLATRWVYEAELWLISSSSKVQTSFVGLQAMCVLRLAKQTLGLEADLAWLPVGNLVRAAMCMGLHLDPSRSGAKPRDLKEIEMRRRLWTTVLEIDLQSSMDSGGLPMLTLDDFDTEPPRNFDDAQLVACQGQGQEQEQEQDSVPTSPEPRDANLYSQTSLQIALHQSLPIRLKIARTINEMRFRTSYETIIQLSEELSVACQKLRKQLASFPPGESGMSGISVFQSRTMELLTQRFFFALHIPVLAISWTDPTYYFSRKVCLDTSLHICQLAGLLPSGRGGMTDLSTDLYRLVNFASGLRRTAVFQSVGYVSFELSTRKEERKNQGSPVALGDAELRTILERSWEGVISGIRSGETNCKGTAAIKVFLAHADGIDAGLEGQDLQDYMEKEASNGIRLGYEALKERASGLSVANTPNSTQFGSDLGLPFDFDDDLLGWGMLQDWEDVAGAFDPIPKGGSA